MHGFVGSSMLSLLKGCSALAQTILLSEGSDGRDLLLSLLTRLLDGFSSLYWLLDLRPQFYLVLGWSETASLPFFVVSTAFFLRVDLEGAKEDASKERTLARLKPLPCN